MIADRRTNERGGGIRPGNASQRSTTSVRGHRRWAFSLVAIGMDTSRFIGASLRMHLGDPCVAGGPHFPFVHGGAVVVVMWLNRLWIYRRRIFRRI